jgi:hypothetical protein
MGTSEGAAAVATDGRILIGDFRKGLNQSLQFVNN